LFEGRSSSQRSVAIQPDIARRTRARRRRQLTQCQRFLLPRLGRAARSKARREQIIGDGEPPLGSRGEPGSTTPSVPLPPAHSPWRGAHAKCDHCFSSFACRTHASVELDVLFSGIDDGALWNAGRTPTCRDQAATARSHHSIVMSSKVEISLIISSLEFEIP
jgi:hypothetical protein